MNKIVISMICILSYMPLKAQTTSFCFSKQLGGISDDISYSIKTDSSGNIYTTGLFKGTADFNPDTGVFNLTASGGSDLFLSKLSPSGQFIWAIKMGGSSNDIGRSFDIDHSGNIYLTGSFSGKADFNPGQDTCFIISKGEDDVFIVKLDALGRFVWAKRIGGMLREHSTSLQLDSSGNIYVAGAFSGTVDFDPGTDIKNATSKGGTDIFILKLDSAGAYIWVKKIGGSYNDIAHSLNVDKDGNVYSTGSFDGTVDFNPDPTAVFNLVSFNYDDVFVSKLDSAGRFIWARNFGGNSLDIGYSITTDHFGNVYTTGEFLGPSDFDPSENQYFLSSTGNSHDIFITKLDTSGHLVWAKGFGGYSEEDHGMSIGIDSACNIYITGMYSGTADFDPGNGVYELSALGNYETFISKYSSAGQFIWARTFAVSSYNYGSSITLDKDHNIYTTGYFAGTTDFNPDAPTADLTAFGKTDVFILKMQQDFAEHMLSKPTLNYIIYPNPCLSSVEIIIPETAFGTETWIIELLNYQGVSTLTQTSLNNQFTIGLSHLPAGLYMLKIKVLSQNNPNPTNYPLQKLIKL